MNKNNSTLKLSRSEAVKLVEAGMLVGRQIELNSTRQAIWEVRQAVMKDEVLARFSHLLQEHARLVNLRADRAVERSYVLRAKSNDLISRTQPFSRLQIQCAAPLPSTLSSRQAPPMPRRR